jgi:ribonuclease HII
LARHKGYSTPEHSGALQSHGPTPLHRLSFEPVRCHSMFPVEAEEQLDLFECH